MMNQILQFLQRMKKLWKWGCDYNGIYTDIYGRCNVWMFLHCNSDELLYSKRRRSKKRGETNK